MQLYVDERAWKERLDQEGSYTPLFMFLLDSPERPQPRLLDSPP
jgi:hypothetical protein